jgi:hypothetical protein
MARRGPYDTTMSVYPSSGGVPSEIPAWSGIPCRFVPQLQISPTEAPFYLRAAWVTYDAVTFTGPAAVVDGTQALLDWGVAPWLELASMPGIPWLVFLTELVAPEEEPSYNRAWVGAPWWVPGPLGRAPWVAPFWWDDKAMSLMREVILDATLSRMVW